MLFRNVEFWESTDIVLHMMIGVKCILYLLISNT